MTNERSRYKSNSKKLIESAKRAQTTGLSVDTVIELSLLCIPLQQQWDVKRASITAAIICTVFLREVHCFQTLLSENKQRDIHAQAQELAATTKRLKHAVKVLFFLNLESLCWQLEVVPASSCSMIVAHAAAVKVSGSENRGKCSLTRSCTGVVNVYSVHSLKKEFKKKTKENGGLCTTKYGVDYFQR